MEDSLNDDQGRRFRIWQPVRRRIASKNTRLVIQIVNSLCVFPPQTMPIASISWLLLIIITMSEAATDKRRCWLEKMTLCKVITNINYRIISTDVPG